MTQGRAFVLCVGVFVLALPTLTRAQVVINEVMYDPQGTDTGREWVELYNEGQTDVTMVGGSGKGSWRLSDGSNHTLTDPASGTGRGSLTVPAGGYLVIASDPTDFISGEYADGTYSVVKSAISLNNNGAALTLIDGTGTTADTVSYSPSQGGNDDGSSLQRQADGSWIAALPTPGAANSSVAYVAPQTQASSMRQMDTTSATTSDQTQPTEPSYVPPPAPSLYADAGSDRVVIVGADVEFDAGAYDKTQTLLDPASVRFLWNFGDGSIAEGDSVLHHFTYPGQYVVVLDIADNRNAAEAQITVTAQPAALSFSLLPDDGVEIQNLAGRDLDLSGWVVREDSGPYASQFIVPKDSKVLSDSSMQLSPQVLSFRASSSTVLDYPNGAPALTMGQSSATTSSSLVETKQAAPIPVSPLAVETPIDQTSKTDLSENIPDPDVPEDDEASDTPATTTILQTASTTSAPASKYLWWFGVVALACAVLAAVIAAGRFKRGAWDIVEESRD